MTDRIDGVFAALADPTRRQSIARLAAGEATAGEIAGAFPISPQAISKHLNVLEAAGLITRTRQAQWRRCRLDAGPLRDVALWVSQYRQHWEQRYDALESYLATIHPEEQS
jgi:DNA-binding transcriptional ArsR family regulator